MPTTSNLAVMATGTFAQVLDRCRSLSAYALPLTRRKETISIVMLRNWNTQGNCAEAGLLRNEFGIPGLRYAGRIRSPLPVSGIAALGPIVRFLLQSKVGV